jgi:hypothetical protein
MFMFVILFKVKIFSAKKWQVKVTDSLFRSRIVFLENVSCGNIFFYFLFLFPANVPGQK